MRDSAPLWWGLTIIVIMMSGLWVIPAIIDRLQNGRRDRSRGKKRLPR